MIFLLFLPFLDPKCSIASTICMPSFILPKTMCLPSNHWDIVLLQMLVIQFLLSGILTLELLTQEFTEQHNFCFQWCVVLPQSLPESRTMACFCLAPYLFSVVLPSPLTRTLVTCSPILMTITSLLKFLNIFLSGFPSQ